MELSFEEKQFIERQVNSFLEQYGYFPETDTYVDIVNLVKKFGFVVGNTELDPLEDGFIIIQSHKGDSLVQRSFNSNKVIGVNSNRSLDWKRFIIAHEFAHSVLHYNGEDIFLHRESKKGRNNQENAADYFAAALLMPKDSFIRVYRNLVNFDYSPNTICYRLAAIYKVPYDSARRRIDEICN